MRVAVPKARGQKRGGAAYSVFGVFSPEAGPSPNPNGSLTIKARRIRVTMPGFLQNAFIWSS
eukprot:922533-Prymnesium_polylepis.1